jgi:hypothetical protein
MLNERDQNLAEILAQEARAENADLEKVVRRALTLYSRERQDAILEAAREIRPTY